MLPYILLVSGFVVVVATYMYARHRAHQIETGVVPEMYGENGGLTEVYLALFRTYRIVYRTAVTIKKLLFQYIFHVLVRILYYLKYFANGAYTFARNQFVRNAVKSKVSVSFFWDHLKEYKRQIEKEKKD